MEQLLLICILLTTFIVFYWFLKRKYSYWSDRNIAGPKPVYLFGNILSKTFVPTPELEVSYMKQYGMLYGTYHGMKPALTVIDNELIKQIMIKDFHCFTERRIPNTYHKIWNQNLFLNNGESWKRIRSITSPTFTSGKLKGMYSLMDKCIDKLINRLDRMTQNGKYMLNVKQEISGFTIDVIATTSFATEIQIFNDNQKELNQFVQNGMNLFNINSFKFAASFTLPRLILDLLNIKVFFNQEAFEFFINLAKQIVYKRRSSNIKRNDLVQLLMNACIDEKELKDFSYDKLTASYEETGEKEGDDCPKSNQKGLNDDEIIAQCMVFFVAGFETTASTISHCLYELALNYDIQNRLVKELKCLKKCESHEDYYKTVMTNLPYLDAVVQETMRKHPPVIRTERILNTDNYKLANITLFKGQEIEVPIYAVHHCEDYYPQPDLFNPDRFLPENKHLLKPYTYMPFGLGPRNCVGMRFAYQEIKLMLAKVVPKFRFSTCSETDIPLKFKIGGVLLGTQNIKLNIEKRH